MSPIPFVFDVGYTGVNVLYQCCPLLVLLDLKCSCGPKLYACAGPIYFSLNPETLVAGLPQHASHILFLAN